ncbi:DNA-binding response regulator [Pedobacter chinensis]|uniref:DNA-binding response regulator n=1 Tax=Pedobacter chinensis TaxID=2282421 RepID=A0A369PWC9_9SPHI|nr:LytTR family DNA-binding domain-containing protein [Pedobacter chinensis]RDC54999.1 DNA-binding response regulator [Pedobacter chinensis]
MVKTLKCVIVDDEPLAAALIKSYAEATEHLEISGVFEDAIVASEFLNINKIDLLFLDINMPDITGIDLFKSLKNKPMLIFTTAYKNFAFEGFELEAIDYLLKPIDYFRFKKAVNKAKEFYRYQHEKQTTGAEESIFVHSEYKLIKINLADILYIESLEDYVKIHLQGSKMVLTLMSLKKMMDKLPADNFKRIHRSFMVSVQKIKAIHNRKIELVTGDILPVSDTYAEVINEWKNS